MPSTSIGSCGAMASAAIMASLPSGVGDTQHPRVQWPQAQPRRGGVVGREGFWSHQRQIGLDRAHRDEFEIGPELAFWRNNHVVVGRVAVNRLQRDRRKRGLKSLARRQYRRDGRPFTLRPFEIGRIDQVGQALQLGKALGNVGAKRRPESEVTGVVVA